MPIALAACALAAELAGDRGRALLRYQRDAVLDGECWRLLSCSLVHLGWRHLLLNAAGLAMIWALCRTELAGARGWCAALAAALTVGLGL